MSFSRAQWLRVQLRTLDYENPGSNPGCGVKPWAGFFTLHYSSSPSCINEYHTVVDMCTSSLRSLIVAYGWMLPREAEMVSGK